jgi:hypothetical protein
LSEKTKHIVISETNYETLKQPGKMQETFDDVNAEVSDAATPVLLANESAKKKEYSH